DRPETRVDGTRLAGFGFVGLPGPVAARTGWLLGVEAAMNRGPLLLQGEYFRYGLERDTPGLKDPVFGGWYAEAAYLLTGETRPFNTASAAFGSPVPAKPFSRETR